MPELTLDDGTRRRYLDIAHQETHKLEAIIGELLDLARLEGGGSALDEEEVLADDLFRRVADRHRPVLCDRHITLDSSTAPGTPHIWGDADRLEQALQNVAANAIRHTPDGGRVTLLAEPDGIASATVADRPGHSGRAPPASSIGSTKPALAPVPGPAGSGLAFHRPRHRRRHGGERASNARRRRRLHLPAAPGGDRR